MGLFKSVNSLFGSARPAPVPLDPATQKRQLEELFTAAFPFAQKMLTSHGEFLPYGATMNPAGKISAVGGYTGKEQSKSGEVIALLKEAYRADGASGNIIACAVAYDARVIPPGQAEKTDAVAIAVDHRDGMSLTMFTPYRIGADKTVTFGQLYGTRGLQEIFPKRAGA